MVSFGQRDRTIPESESLPQTHLESAQSRRRCLLISLLIASCAVSCAKRTDPAPLPARPPAFEFLGAWGDRGKEPGKLDTPAAFATDAMGRVFFADPGSGFVHKFESKGTPLLSFEDSRMNHASGIAVDSGGAIYVADTERGNVLIFFPDGTFLRSIRIASQRHFSPPLCITVDDQGNLYVPDPAASRVVKFDAHGRLAKSWKAPQNPSSSEERPAAVAASQDGEVFVAYPKTGRVEKYSSAGSWMASWMTGSNDAAASGTLTGIAVGGTYVFTFNTAPPRIRVWTLDGQHQLDDNLGGYLDSVASPQIAVTPRAELLVLDPVSPRVYHFRMNL